MSYPQTSFTVHTSPLLATIAELEHRLEMARQQLAHEVQQAYHTQSAQSAQHAQHVQQAHRPSGRVPYYSSSTGSVGRTAIQLQGGVSSSYPPSTARKHPRARVFSSALSPSAPPFVPASRPSKKPAELISVPLSSVLSTSEEVVFRIILRKNESGQHVYGSLIAVFNGEQLVVTQSEHAPSLIGLSSVKPGEILYRFMESLKEIGLLKRSFTVAPWRLCSVVRGGVEQTLEELRRKFLQGLTEGGVKEKEKEKEEKSVEEVEVEAEKAL